jgi:hypothetical protein
MNALLIDGGEPWILPFERVTRIDEAGKLHPFVVGIAELSGLLTVENALVPVWEPLEFARSGQVVVLYYGDDGLQGLHVNQVLGLRQIEEATREHGELIALEDGQRGRWFDLDVLERRIAGQLPEE